MTVQVNFPGDARGLQRAFGLKGGVKLVVDEVIAPVSILQDVEQGPWASSTGVTGFRSRAALAARFGGILFIPGRGVTTKIEQLEIENLEATRWTANIEFITPAEIALLTAGAPNSMINAQDVFGPTGGTVEVRITGSRLNAMTHTATLGEPIFSGEIPANGSRVFKFPQGIFINGDVLEAGVPGGLIVWNTTLNTFLAVSFLAREYPNRQ